MESEKENWDNLLDKRLVTEPLNWSKTYICLLFEIDCSSRSMMIQKIEKKKN